MSSSRFPFTLRILVADADPDAREALRLLLPLLGCRVDAAADGREAIRMALANRPDMALIELRLPGLDGLAVVRAIRAAYGGAVLVLAYSGRDDAGPEAKAAGFDALLVKPVGSDALARWLAVAAARRL
jgi:CheY-like chemotaxis protein